MGPPLHARNQTAVGGSRWFSAKESEVDHICQKKYGQCVLGCQRDPTPSDFHLFPNLKKFISGKLFTSNEDVERAVDEFLNSLPDTYIQEGILILEKRWTKCVNAKGDYIERKKKTFFKLKIGLLYCQAENFSPYPRI
ncbi:hypothetical protein LAZ67_11002454 [Cordylochernes scorpioides]|uniref:Histone-lysine N-methyltransferase SETMAR n=1 Tax=Cordylochernes scorpioides TaxID=51811 RepID=A0ABY6KZA4_9ARAC|nr:hypothetical protein LAZ67_11002454 [Cordylochernes scorpioides]